MRQTFRRGCVVVALLFIAGCDQAGTMTELPRPTAAPAKVVSFTGTLLPQGRDSYTFTVAQDGYVQATLVGLGIGTASATATCSVIQSVTTAAGPAAQLIGTGLAGTLCVTIFDEGMLTAPTLYTITVASS